MDKKVWRKEMKETLGSLDPSVKREAMSRIYSSLFSLEIWKQSKTIGITVSVGDEIDTWPIIKETWEQGKQAAVPKCVPNQKELSFYILNDISQLENSFYGLKEPDPTKCELFDNRKIDLLIVPGLVFDRKGYRVGHGGGYYDRFLASNPLETVSLCYDFQVVNELPAETHDIPVKWLVTPTELIYADCHNSPEKLFGELGEYE
ncbi:5-formyltetrahydrofolate cyclo-ligase [Salipaludibacillus sp. CUR1]|uniref:5-formyltetrahydrofolate cyclo-ligase n=1 Tax=Salipaludibacillus sp. CUR1 TaxID=2820003 RepID=UPI001E4228AE|nr:5-formyltetrahydrofolate cyclo-ligase [Salipaludibacillus sp. CUR1]MCE7794268.1 5-formyltetrahydrofolate cyclo-ligase [Salipaludibacillus sp. CUR1]